MNVLVRSMYVLPNARGNLKAYASIMYEDVLINNLVVLEDKDGNVRVAPPTILNKNPKQKERKRSRIVNFYNKKSEINKVVLEAYYKALQEKEASNLHEPC